MGRYRDTNRSDKTYRFLSQGREVGTAVTEYSKLNVTGNGVTHKEIHQQRRALNCSNSSRLPVGKYKVSSENKM